MILHLVSDEKFIDNAIWQFESVLPDNNVYVALMQNKTNELKYIKNTKKVKRIIIESNEYFNLINEFNKYNAVILHNLDYDKARLVNKSSKEIIFYWIVWGMELYSINRLKKSLLQKKTVKYFINNRVLYGFKNKFRSVKYFFKGKPPIESTLIKAFSRVDYCSAFYASAQYFLESKFKIKPNYFKFTYYPIEYILGDLINSNISNNNILLGNSSSLSNNHIEIIEQLSKMRIDDKCNIICPLNYGDPLYRKKLIKYSTQYLGDKFLPLLNFMPLNKYNEILKTCSIAIMNHLRPQAFGNIVTMLWLGAKVYLNEENYLYSGLKENGIILFSITKDLMSEDFLNTEPLDQQAINNNRLILLKLFGKTSTLQYVNNIISNIYSI